MLIPVNFIFVYLNESRRLLSDNRTFTMRQVSVIWWQLSLVPKPHLVNQTKEVIVMCKTWVNHLKMVRRKEWVMQSVYAVDCSEHETENWMDQYTQAAGRDLKVDKGSFLLIVTWCDRSCLILHTSAVSGSATYRWDLWDSPLLIDLLLTRAYERSGAFKI